MPRMCCCAQEDTFIPTLTLWETLWLSTCLHMSSAVPRPERYVAMLTALQSMGLSKVIHSQVGGMLPLLSS